jgi:hypothetical protein
MRRALVVAACVSMGALPLARPAAGAPEIQPAAPAERAPGKAAKARPGKLLLPVTPARQAIGIARRLKAAGKALISSLRRQAPLARPPARASKTPRTGVNDPAIASNSARPPARPSLITAYYSRLPKRDQSAMKKLLDNPRLRTSVPLQRAVAAVMVLRGMKGGHRLPVSLYDLQAMSNSRAWTPKRIANLAKVLRQAAAIAAAEGIGANAAFQKALKVYGIDQKFNKRVCGV